MTREFESIEQMFARERQEATEAQKGALAEQKVAQAKEGASLTEEQRLKEAKLPIQIDLVEQLRADALVVATYYKEVGIPFDWLIDRKKKPGVYNAVLRKVIDGQEERTYDVKRGRLVAARTEGLGYHVDPAPYMGDSYVDDSYYYWKVAAFVLGENGEISVCRKAIETQQLPSLNGSVSSERVGVEDVQYLDHDDLDVVGTNLRMFRGSTGNSYIPLHSIASPNDLFPPNLIQPEDPKHNAGLLNEWRLRFVQAGSYS